MSETTSKDEVRLPPDVMGHMAGLGGTDLDHGICPSCMRALHYGTLAKVAVANVKLQRALDNLNKIAPRVPFGSRVMDEMAADLRAAIELNTEIIAIHLEISAFDMEQQITPDYWLDTEERRLGLKAFYESRIEHFVNEDGLIQLEPHTEGYEHD